MFSKNFSGGISDIEIDDVDLGIGWILGSAFDTTSNHHSVAFHGSIVTNWVWDLDGRWSFVTVDKLAPLPESETDERVEGEGQVVHLIGGERGQFDRPGAAFKGKSPNKHPIPGFKAEVLALHKNVITIDFWEYGFDVVADTAHG